MSREIDFTKPLSKRDRQYLLDRGRTDLIERADAIAAGEEDYASRLTESGVRVDPNTIVSGDGKLPLPPHTGDVNASTEEVLSANEQLDYDPGAYTVAQLQAMPDEDLDELLEARGLPRTGLQAEKIARLISTQGQNLQRDVSEDAGKTEASGSNDDEDEEEAGSGPTEDGAHETVPLAAPAGAGMTAPAPAPGDSGNAGSGSEAGTTPDPGGMTGTAPANYDRMDGPALREELARRGLSTSGSLDQMRARLRKNDGNS